MFINYVIFELSMAIIGLTFLGPVAIQTQKENKQNLCDYYIPILQEFVANWYENPCNEFLEYEFTVWEITEYLINKQIAFNANEIKQVLDYLSTLPTTSYLKVWKNSDELYGVMGLFPSVYYKFDRLFK